MAEEPADRDAVVVELALRQGPAREIGRNRRVEIELPGLDQGHHPPGRDPLAHGGDLEQRVAIDGLADRREVLVEDLSVLDQDEGDIAAAGPVDLCDRRIHEGSPVARRRERLTPPAFQGSGNENAGPDHQREDGGQHDEENSAHVQTPTECRDLRIKYRTRRAQSGREEHVESGGFGSVQQLAVPQRIPSHASELPRR